MSRRVIVAKDTEALSELAGKALIDLTVRAIAERGRATVLVSGGTSVWRAYEVWGTAHEIDWTKVYFFWGDDRFVEPDNPYSNYGLVCDALFAHTKDLPNANVFPIPFDAVNPTVAAEKYAQTIANFFQLGDGEWPVFDIAQNGLGPDGHTASIFPGTPPTTVEDKIAVANHAGLKPWVDRITLTFPVFNHARTVLFIAGGAAKTKILARALQDNNPPDVLPAGHINPINGNALFLTDEAGAADLTIPVEKTFTPE